MLAWSVSVYISKNYLLSRLPPSVSLSHSLSGFPISHTHTHSLTHSPSYFTLAVHTVVATHTCPAYALAWGAHMLVSGADRRTVALGPTGRMVQQFDHTSEPGERAATVALASPSGNTVVVASYNR